MRKLLFILMLSAIVALTSGCGSRRSDEEFNEAEAIGLILYKPEEETAAASSSEESEEMDQVTSDQASPVTNAPGYVPSKSEKLTYKKLAGKYTSDNGNIYSVKFYSSPKDGKVGKITIDHPKMDFKESLEIVEEETNVFQVYETQDYFVFDMNGDDYTLAFYKDGLFADITVKNKKSK